MLIFMPQEELQRVFILKRVVFLNIKHYTVYKILFFSRKYVVKTHMCVSGHCIGTSPYTVPQNTLLKMLFRHTVYETSAALEDLKG